MTRYSIFTNNTTYLTIFPFSNILTMFMLILTCITAIRLMSFFQFLMAM